MIRFFKSLQPATLIIIPIIILVFWIRAISHSLPVSDNNVLAFWTVISTFLAGLPSWLNFIFLFGLISGEAIYLNLMINRHEVHYKNTFVPALIFALIISSTPGLMQFHPVHVINLLLLMIIDRSFTLFKNEFPVSALFDSGFLAGIAALIYFPAVILLPLLLTSLAVLRPFRLKEWLITLIGFFIPFFFMCTYMFWKHSLSEFCNSYLLHFREIHAHLIVEKSLKIIILTIYISVLLLLSLFKLRLNYRKNIIRTRSYQQVFFILLLFGIAWLILSGTISVINFAFLIVPVSIFCSYYFVSAKKRVMLYEYALWALIAVIVWNHLG